MQSHFPEWKFQAADTIADSALHAALLARPPQTLGDVGENLASRLECSVVALCRGSARIDEGRGSNAFTP